MSFGNAPGRALGRATAPSKALAVVRGFGRGLVETVDANTPSPQKQFQSVCPKKTHSLATFFLVSGVLLLNSPSNAAYATYQETESKQQQQNQQEDQKEPSQQELRQVAGSRLLTPASFGFDIPTANVVTSDLTLVDTMDEFEAPVVGRVHCKVGDNYVVMLPNGNLVSRTPDQVAASDKKFKPISAKALGRQVLANQLASFSKMKFEKSKHYVYLYNTTTGFKRATRGILESMYNGVKAYSENMGIETHHPDVPLVVIMFQTRREFEAYRPDIASGVVAYYDMVSNHIVLCEESPWADIRPDLAQGQLLSTIAHEGAHQILHNIGTQQRLSMWPMWLSEGIAEFFAPTSFNDRNRWKGAGRINDFRMFELESYLQTRAFEGLDGNTITGAVTAGKLDSTGYATAWSIVHYLVKKDRKKFNQLVAQMSQLKPMRGMVARPDQPVIANLEHFKAFFGDDMQETEVDMVEYLKDLSYVSPVADFYHYVGMVQVPSENGTKRFACVFHTQQKVAEWKSVLESKMTTEQRDAAVWEAQKANNRSSANLVIRRFLK